ncbi:hypothetical protein PR048_003706 [Dryococelus australis]|uniref:Uncharacterized protein n=1 Tax=Dryococelus australis TaxID=614101 RepID=A0ABQ9INX4_9NEOP|nr:hypothetical protein PR048_003706 [Dryococelus australis]
MKGLGKREIPEKTRQQAGTISSYENSGDDPVGNRTWFTSVGGEQANRSATAAFPDLIRLEIASQKQSSDIHKTPYDLVKWCRERKINIKASERVNVDRPSAQSPDILDVVVPSRNLDDIYVNMAAECGRDDYFFLASPQILLRQREHLFSSVCPPACLLVAKTVGESDASQGKPSGLSGAMAEIVPMDTPRKKKGLVRGIENQRQSGKGLEKTIRQSRRINIIPFIGLGLEKVGVVWNECGTVLITRAALHGLGGGIPEPSHLPDRGLPYSNTGKSISSVKATRGKLRARGIVPCMRPRYKIDFKRVYTEVTFTIGSEFIRHSLKDSAPIADLKGNKKRIPYCQMWGNDGATANEQTSEGHVSHSALGSTFFLTVELLVPRPLQSSAQPPRTTGHKCVSVGVGTRLALCPGLYLLPDSRVPSATAATELCPGHVSHSALGSTFLLTVELLVLRPLQSSAQPPRTTGHKCVSGHVSRSALGSTFLLTVALLVPRPLQSSAQPPRTTGHKCVSVGVGTRLALCPGLYLLPDSRVPSATAATELCPGHVSHSALGSTFFLTVEFLVLWPLQSSAQPPRTTGHKCVSGHVSRSALGSTFLLTVELLVLRPLQSSAQQPRTTGHKCVSGHVSRSALGSTFFLTVEFLVLRPLQSSAQSPLTTGHKCVSVGVGTRLALCPGLYLLPDSRVPSATAATELCPAAAHHGSQVRGPLVRFSGRGWNYVQTVNTRQKADTDERNTRISPNALDADALRRNLLHPDWLPLIATYSTIAEPALDVKFRARWNMHTGLKSSHLTVNSLQLEMCCGLPSPDIAATSWPRKNTNLTTVRARDPLTSWHCPKLPRYSDRVDVTSLDAGFRTRPCPQELPDVDTTLIDRRYSSDDAQKSSEKMRKISHGLVREILRILHSAVQGKTRASLCDAMQDTHAWFFCGLQGKRGRGSDLPPPPVTQPGAVVPACRRLSVTWDENQRHIRKLTFTGLWKPT